MKKGRGGSGHPGWSQRGEKSREDEARKRLVRIAALVAAAGVLALLAWLLFRGSDHAAAPETQEHEETASPPVTRPIQEDVRRGSIYDRNYHELAISFNVNSIYVKPLEFDDIEKTVAQLAQALELDEQSVLNEVKTQRSYKWLVKYITPEKTREVQALKLSGVYFYEQEQRYYPYRQETGHIIGEVKDEHGLSGIELFYDGLLSGKEGNGDGGDTKRKKGSDLMLSLDVRIQKLLDQQLVELLDAVKGEEEAASRSGVAALLMEADSGEILAWGSIPSFTGMKALDGMIGTADKVVTGAVDPGPLSLLFKVGAALQEDYPLEPTTKKVVTIKRLKPRKMKMAAGGPDKPEWVELEDGNFLSEWLAAALPEEVVENLHDFDDYFDGSGGYSLDLPDIAVGEQSGLALLSRFAAMVNGGRRVAPHFRKAPLIADKGERAAPAAPVDDTLISAQASGALVRYLRNAMPADASVLSAETLSPYPSVAPATVSLGAEVGDGADGAVINVEVAAAAGGETVAIDQMVRKSFRCDAVVLAAAPAAAPKLVLLLLADNARVAIDRGSPFRQHATLLLQNALQFYDRKADRRATTLKTSRETLFHQWLRQGEQIGAEEKGEVAAKDVMIDLKGLSLRKAMQELERFDVKVVVKGSGVVIRQHPAVGDRVRAGGVVVLQAEQR
ncbi:MAG: PASTA domain-containing protein [Thermodesulfobacteriota bacterium]